MRNSLCLSRVHLVYNRRVNEDQINDLKQFIASTVSQATADLATKDDVKNVENKVDDLDLKVDTISDTLNNDLNQLETRLTKLEQSS